MVRQWYEGRLPTLEEMRAEVRWHVSEAQSVAASDWLEGTGLSAYNWAAFEAWQDAREHLQKAKDALDRMAGEMHG